VLKYICYCCFYCSLWIHWTFL